MELPTLLGALSGHMIVGCASGREHTFLWSGNLLVDSGSSPKQAFVVDASLPTTQALVTLLKDFAQEPAVAHGSPAAATAGMAASGRALGAESYCGQVFALRVLGDQLAKFKTVSSFASGATPALQAVRDDVLTIAGGKLRVPTDLDLSDLTPDFSADEVLDELVEAARWCLFEGWQIFRPTLSEREDLLKSISALARDDSETPENQRIAAQETLRDNWKILLPTCEERVRALQALLPKPTDSFSVMDGNRFMISLLLTSLLGDPDFALAFHVNGLLVCVYV